MYVNVCNSLMYLSNHVPSYLHWERLPFKHREEATVQNRNNKEAVQKSSKQEDGDWKFCLAILCEQVQ